MTDAHLQDILGFTDLEASADECVIRWTVGDVHLQAFGIVNGGTYCAAHEIAASWGAVWALQGTDKIPVGVNNSTDFIRPAKVGDTITTTARAIHKGATQQLWRVESVNQQGKLVSQGQVRLANIEKPTG